MDKNQAQGNLYKMLTILIPIVAGGLFIWLLTYTNSVSSGISEIKTDIQNIKKDIQVLREDKNRDIDRLRKDFIMQNNNQGIKPQQNK